MAVSCPVSFLLRHRIYLSCDSAAAPSSMRCSPLISKLHTVPAPQYQVFPPCYLSAVFCVCVCYLGLWFILICVLCKDKHSLRYTDFVLIFFKTQQFCWPLAFAALSPSSRMFLRTLFTWRACVSGFVSGLHHEGLADRAASNLLPAHRKKKEPPSGSGRREPYHPPPQSLPGNPLWHAAFHSLGVSVASRYTVTLSCRWFWVVIQQLLMSLAPHFCVEQWISSLWYPIQNVRHHIMALGIKHSSIFKELWGSLYLSPLLSSTLGVFATLNPAVIMFCKLFNFAVWCDSCHEGWNKSQQEMREPIKERFWFSTYNYQASCTLNFNKRALQPNLFDLQILVPGLCWQIQQTL